MQIEKSNRQKIAEAEEFLNAQADSLCVFSKGPKTEPATLAPDQASLHAAVQASLLALRSEAKDLPTEEESTTGSFTVHIQTEAFKPVERLPEVDQEELLLHVNSTLSDLERALLSELSEDKKEPEESLADLATEELSQKTLLRLEHSVRPTKVKEKPDTDGLKKEIQAILDSED